MLPTRRRSGLAVVLALCTWIGAAPTDTARAGVTCTTVSTYDHSGSPYDVGSAGLMAGAGDCIVVDASAGPVVFEFAQGAGVVLASGSIETTNTSPTNTVTFEPEPGAMSWSGISSGPPDTPGFGPAPLIQLTNTTIVGAGVSMETDDLSLSDSTIDGPLCDLFSDAPDDASANIDSLTVSTATGCPGDFNAVDVGSGGSGAVTMTNSTVTVTSPSILGVQLVASGSGGPEDPDPPDSSDVDLVAHGNAINGVQAGDALTVGGIMNNDALTGVGGNTGQDDSDPVTDYENAATLGSLTWSPAPSDDSTPHALGIDGQLAVYNGQATIEPDAAVGGELTVPQGVISAPTGPTYFYGNLSAQSVDLANADVLGDVAIMAGTSNIVSTIANSSISGSVNLSTASTTGEPLGVTGSAISGGVDVTSPGGGTVDVASSRLSGSTTYGLLTSGQASLSCDIVTSNLGGVSVGAGSTISDSVLTGNANPPALLADLRSTADSDSPVDAESNYWGQPGGPVSGQVIGPADTSNPIAATPACAATDPAAPTPVSALTSHPGDQSVTLTWINPTDPTFAGDVVRMLPGDRAPLTPDQGTQVYSGSGTTTTVTGLHYGQTYSFAVFSSSSDANQPGVAATGGSSRAPLPVTDLTANPGFGTATLDWTPSADSGTTTLICAGVFGEVPNPTTCDPVYSGAATNATVTLSFTSTHYYVWAKDSEGTLSEPTTLTVYAVSLTGGPTIDVGDPTSRTGSSVQIAFNVLGGDPANNAMTAQLYEITPAGKHVIVQTKTNQTVGVTFTVREKVKTTYFAVVDPNATTAGVISPTFVASPDRYIALHQPKAVKHEYPRTITGRIVPRTGLTRIPIYSYTITHFYGSIVARPKVGRNGRFHFTVRPAKKGTYGYGVQTKMTSNFGYSFSNIIELHAT